MSFQVIFTVTNATAAEMLSAATWLKDQYGGKILQAQGGNEGYSMNGVILAIDFPEMISIIQALDAEFSDRLTWRFNVKDLV